MTDETRLIDLAMRYEELAEQGIPPRPEELCKESPELLEGFKQRIAALDALRARGIGAIKDDMALSPQDGEATPTSAVPVSSPIVAVPGYKLFEVLGRGGMGVVYRARDQRLDRDVAVKLLADDVPANSAPATRFVIEVKITGQLQHPGIPAVHELGQLPDGRPFLAMKLVKGQTLHSLLAGRPSLLGGRGVGGEGADVAQDVAQNVAQDVAQHGRYLAICESICDRDDFKKLLAELEKPVDKQ